MDNTRKALIVAAFLSATTLEAKAAPQLEQCEYKQYKLMTNSCEPQEKNPENTSGTYTS